MTKDISSSVVVQNARLTKLLALYPYSTSIKSARSFIEDCLAIKVSDTLPAGRGLVFTRPVQAGQVLLTLQSDSLINVKSYKEFFHPKTLPAATGIAGVTKRFESRLTSAQLLSLLLARAKVAEDCSEGVMQAGETSKKHQALKLFIQTLPENFDTVPLTWSLLAIPVQSSDAEGSASSKHFFKSLLAALPNHSQHLLQKVRNRFIKDWQTFSSLRSSHIQLLTDPSLLVLNPDLARASVERITSDVYLWAWLCVNTRCVFSPLNLADHADNFTLAPMLDMANHTPDPVLECKVRYAPDGGLELCAPNTISSPIDTGDECFITYGPHSNQVLLSEYGFVLPPHLSFRADDGGGQSGAEWKASRYVDVILDREVESLLKAQGESGERKIELLQNRGYWREFTIHPYPDPPHPSHRLVPALRLVALDLDAQKPRRKIVKVKTQAGLKAGKKPAFNQAYGKADQQDEEITDLDRWEETLVGYRDNVGERNEEVAHRILVDLCETRLKDAQKARRYLVDAEEILASTEEGNVAQSNGNGCALSLAFVKQLLDEEEAVLRLVSQAAKDQVEW
ncbi:related to RKM2 - ribosomal protein lysine methyltransferase [Melanopsichium pennsylvanicum]|uniref:Related to RKM2 - ribosomal protein lysine methyltransferase n=2 Tax=Melanopsichium pennsylvanicum TaxID=63383 RepID=A0AAJ4XNF0_9BASI|nr:conserved hypothetical protein [Melanopsichium pennsylvanicum 4]SNX85480.1 related to RKM2 - ribosomal protein lysine methyltransferase [Melanopsichium pennsylvanicum]